MAETFESAPGAGTQHERIPVLIFEQSAKLAQHVARRIANMAEENRSVGRKLVLGLPTGSTPIGVYQNLIRLHREEGLDLSNVVTFNLDEYYPMDPEALQSYHRFMWENFFAHVNIPRENIHIPRGDIPRSEVETHVLTYEHQIQKAGGIDILLLGIGRSGHIGFNEPGSERDTRTRMITLDEITRKDAADNFFGEENVPREAITMGVGTILDAREIILMATGEHKAAIVRRAVEGEPTKDVTASFLQGHPNASFYVDAPAAAELTRVKTPWLVQSVKWDREMTWHAVLWLSERLQKSIMRLEKSDFHRNHLHELAYAHKNVDALCLEIFEDLRRRVRYKDRFIKGQRVIVFSPHPDDDVISMGGTLGQLAANGNDVTIAYMTNGSVGVFDADVRSLLRVVQMSYDALGAEGAARKKMEAQRERIWNFLDNKGPGQADSEEVQALKAHIRYAEAISGIGVLGLDERHARFLDLPFYRTGGVRKDPIGEADIEGVLNLLEEIRPDHIFVAGDRSDPHGTHRMCYVAICEALARYNAGSGAGNGPLVWLYRGAWQEWETHVADAFVPLSKMELERKIDAIFKHESQKDRAMFAGAYDERELWQRARDRNRETADVLNRLGLPEFYAAEAFVCTREMP